MTWKTGRICNVDQDPPIEPPTQIVECKETGGTDWAECTPDNPCKLFKQNKDSPPVQLSIAGKYNTVCPTNNPDAIAWYYSDQWGMICLINTITYLTNWLFYIMIIAVVILFVIAGAWFMLAGGDVEKTGKAKGLMTLGVVGLAIALLAKLIPSVVKLLVGM